MASSLIKPETGILFVNRVQENICSISAFLEQLQDEHTDSAPETELSGIAQHMWMG